MRDFGQTFQLAPWQLSFAEEYLANPRSTSVLVAPPGTGKTVTSLYVATQLRARGEVDGVLFLADRIALRDQWNHVAQDHGVELRSSLAELRMAADGGALTIQTATAAENADLIAEIAQSRRWLLVVDEYDRRQRSAMEFSSTVLRHNGGSKALFLTSTPLREHAFDAEFRFHTEFIFNRDVLVAPETEARVSLHAPSFSLIRTLQRQGASLDGLSWRQFERLVADLLEADGYTVELMKGTKDGGVDVVAVKDLGANGWFKSVWQAKKQDRGNKVGISVVRELADTRREWGASKAVIVTSSYLTRGALDRIQRDKFTLGKMDRDDVEAWVRRTLSH